MNTSQNTFQKFIILPKNCSLLGIPIFKQFINDNNIKIYNEKPYNIPNLKHVIIVIYDNQCFISNYEYIDIDNNKENKNDKENEEEENENNFQIVKGKKIKKTYNTNLIRLEYIIKNDKKIYIKRDIKNKPIYFYHLNDKNEEYNKHLLIEDIRKENQLIKNVYKIYYEEFINDEEIKYYFMFNNFKLPLNYINFINEENKENYYNNFKMNFINDYNNNINNYYILNDIHGDPLYFLKFISKIYYSLFYSLDKQIEINFKFNDILFYKCYLLNNNILALQIQNYNEIQNNIKLFNNINIEINEFILKDNINNKIKRKEFINISDIYNKKKNNNKLTLSNILLNINEIKPIELITYDNLINKIIQKMLINKSKIIILGDIFDNKELQYKISKYKNDILNFKININNQNNLFNVNKFNEIFNNDNINFNEYYDEYENIFNNTYIDNYNIEDKLYNLQILLYRLLYSFINNEYKECIINFILGNHDLNILDNIKKYIIEYKIMEINENIFKGSYFNKLNYKKILNILNNDTTIELNDIINNDNKNYFDFNCLLFKFVYDNCKLFVKDTINKYYFCHIFSNIKLLNLDNQYIFKEYIKGYYENLENYFKILSIKSLNSNVIYYYNSFRYGLHNKIKYNYEIGDNILIDKYKLYYTNLYQIYLYTSNTFIDFTNNSINDDNINILNNYKDYTIIFGHQQYNNIYDQSKLNLKKYLNEIIFLDKPLSSFKISKLYSLYFDNDLRDLYKIKHKKENKIKEKKDYNDFNNKCNLIYKQYINNQLYNILYAELNKNNIKYINTLIE